MVENQEENRQIVTLILGASFGQLVSSFISMHTSMPSDVCLHTQKIYINYIAF